MLLILSWVPFLLLYVQFAKDGRMKAIFEQNSLYEGKLAYDFGDNEFIFDENRTLAASFDSTPKRKSLLLGENGDGVVIPFFRIKEEEAGYKLHGFNSLASDIIPLERRLKDYRKNE